MTMPEKGWGRKSYKNTTKRREQQKQCGSQCFLKPGRGGRGVGSRPRYPVCSKTSCKPTCGGVQAAFNRARMQKNRTVMRKALRLAKRVRCKWATEYRL